MGIVCFLWIGRLGDFYYFILKLLCRAQPIEGANHGNTVFSRPSPHEYRL